MSEYSLSQISSYYKKLRNGDTLVVIGDANGKGGFVTLPRGLYTAECWGSRGNQGKNNNYGNGGYTKGVLDSSDANMDIGFFAGGVSGENGGGKVRGTVVSDFHGGDATHIVTAKTSSGEVYPLSLYENEREKVLMVAGGGGGGGTYNASYKGGDGGQVGTNGVGYKTQYAATGATQSAGGAAGGYDSSTKGHDGSFGKGGDAEIYSAVSNISGAGGGGWYGGGGGGYRKSVLSAYQGTSGGGGGSSYISDRLTEQEYQTGVRPDYGRICLTCEKLGDYLVDRTLVGCSLDESQNPGLTAYVWNGGSYSATILSYAGYDFSDAVISVTMNDIDITESVYDPIMHTITISQVTGDVMISAQLFPVTVTKTLRSLSLQVGDYQFSVTADNDDPKLEESLPCGDISYHVVPCPSIDGSDTFTYNGAEQGPAFINPNPDRTTREGTMSAVNEGTYSVTWDADSDTEMYGGYSRKTLRWQINSMENVLQANVTEINAAPGGAYTVWFSGDYTASGFNVSASTTKITYEMGSNNDLRIVVASDISVGTDYYVRVRAKGGDHYSASNQVTITITIPD